MPYIYLFVIENRSIVVVCKNKNKILSSLNNGNYTNFFSKRKNEKIVYKKEFEIDITQYLSMIKSLKNNSLMEFHIKNGQYFLTIDNCIWLVHVEEEDADLVLFKEVIFLSSF